MNLLWDSDANTPRKIHKDVARLEGLGALQIEPSDQKSRTSFR